MLMYLAALFITAHAESPNPPLAGKWEARAIYSYFKTEGNYSSTGNTALVRNGVYSQMQGDLMAIYDWQPDWRFTVGANAAYAESDDGVYTRNNSGLNEGYLSAQKWYESGPFDIAPQGDFYFPFWRPDEANDEVLVGEGGMRLRGGAWGFWPLGTYKPFAYLGFEYRDGGRAFLLPYEAGIKFKFPRFWLQASFRGFETVVDDSNTDNQIVRESYLRTVNAGSLKFYSINPSGSEAAAEAGATFGQIGVLAGFAISVNGNNSADGWTAYGGLSWTPVIVSKKHDDGFSIRKERYDEDLFDGERTSIPQFVEDPGNNGAPPPDPNAEPPPDDPTMPPPPPEAAPSKPVEMSVELRRVAPKKKKKPVRKKRNQNIDKLMDDAESSLENSH